MSKEPVYASSTALIPAHKIVAEAGNAIAAPDWSWKAAALPELAGAVGGAAVGAGAGAAIIGAGVAEGVFGGAALVQGLAWAGGLVGGGMAAGIAVAAAPAVVLGVAGVMGVSWWNRTKLTEEKEALLQEAIRKHDAIARKIRKETDANSQKVEELSRLNTLLMEIIKNLKGDLAQEAA